jgi:hypothetical protein
MWKQEGSGYPSPLIVDRNYVIVFKSDARIASSKMLPKILRR